jgi:outer membrane receptor protein involved in Fe transport
VDFSVQFEHDTAAEGSIHYMLDATYLIERPERVTTLSTPFDTVDTYSNPPAFRARGGVGWQREGWTANGFINYTGDYTDNRIAPFVEVGSFTTVDASVNYRFAHDRGALSGLTVALSAQNLLDRDPPSTRIFLDPFLGTPVFDMGFDPANASPLGRLVSLQLTKTW